MIVNRHPSWQTKVAGELKYRRLLSGEFLKENPLISKSVKFKESNA
jgi:hypothetical protein